MHNYVFYSFLILLVVFSLFGCGDKENKTTEPPISADDLFSGSEWIIVLGGAEDYENSESTDAYSIIYNSENLPPEEKVELEINGISYELFLDDDYNTYQFSFADTVALQFETGHNYHIIFKIGGVNQAEYNLKMVGYAQLRSIETFNSAEDCLFEWTLDDNPMVQYFIGESPDNIQSLLGTFGPSQREFTYRGGTLEYQSGYYEFGIVYANYETVNNVKFISMFSSWIDCYQDK